MSLELRTCAYGNGKRIFVGRIYFYTLLGQHSRDRPSVTAGHRTCRPLSWRRSTDDVEAGAAVRTFRSSTV